MHTPPPPLQLLGCGVGVDASPPPPAAFRSVLVGFRAASAGMGWIRATHSCAAVCSLLAYLCRGGGEEDGRGGRSCERPSCCSSLRLVNKGFLHKFHTRQHTRTQSTHGQSVCFHTHVDIAHLRNVSNHSTECAPLAYITAHP